jgi:hypothetical protein
LIFSGLENESETVKRRCDWQRNVKYDLVVIFVNRTFGWCTSATALTKAHPVSAKLFCESLS